MDERQKNQEKLYEFPYHHISYFDKENFFVGRAIPWAHEYLGYIKFVLNSAGKRNFSTLLDIGCGDGKLLLEAKKEFPNKKLVGIDYSEKAIALSRGLCPNVEFIAGDITTDVLGNKKYDIITLIETLEHIPPDQIKSFIKSIHRHLEDDGELIITVPSKNLPVEKKHYQHFSIDSLAETISPYFTISEKYFINKLSKKVELMKIIFSNRFFILNNKFLLNSFFRYYMKNLFFGNEVNTRRICVISKKIKSF